MEAISHRGSGWASTVRYPVRPTWNLQPEPLLGFPAIRRQHHLQHGALVQRRNLHLQQDVQNGDEDVVRRKSFCSLGSGDTKEVHVTHRDGDPKVWSRREGRGALLSSSSSSSDEEEEERFKGSELQRGSYQRVSLKSRLIAQGL
ncbi:hypothetical protein EYF80_042661 [Liparis tanakae]|uniref:Uncharacterized protein n=1 Tax=Liparis tanakae TaxID=230148 RepID=A0A4Z2G0W7_9TELE|nr:hypothetical protein EYF80_042661 [Liparis tanakae]